MQKKIISLFVLLILLLTTTLDVFSEKEMKMEDIKVINFGIISTESTSNLRKAWQPFLDDMEKALGIKVKAFFAGDYAGVIEAMRFNKVQVAWFGNKSAIEAVDRANGEVFAQQVGKGGDPGYYSLIITHKDNKHLNTVEDIIKNGKKLNFGNGDVNSTSGYLIPTYYIWSKNGVDPKTYFKTSRNSNHEANMMAVVMKQVDFATNNTEQWSKFSRTNPDKLKNIKIIWKSPMIPKDPMVWRKDLPRELKSQIKAFFLGYGRVGSKKEVAKQRKVLLGISGGLDPFWDSSNKQLIPIRQLKIAKDIQNIRNDKKYSMSEKKVKIAELEKELNSLESFDDYLDKY
jgi:phosphonate transport system substrate-binding protein